MKFNYRQVDIKTIVQQLRVDGRVSLTEGHGQHMELVAPEKWNSGIDKGEGIFLLFEMFQIRSIALPFSEISLDIVELATKPIVYHTPANAALQNAPLIEGNVKFAMVREGIWNKLLFNFGRPLIYQKQVDAPSEEIKTNEKFPLLAVGVKEMFLGPEGEVKILNG